MVTFEIDTRVLNREIGKIIKKLDKFQEALQLVGDEVEEAIEEAFARKTNGERSWPAWSETTKKVHGTGGSLLQRTGRLKRSIKVEVHDRDVTISVKAPGAAAQQFGFPGNKAWGRGRAPIPARPYMPIKSMHDLTPEMLQRIEEVLEEYFEIE